MKVLLCLDCGDIIAPLPKAREPRLCNCERHAVWWEDPNTGQIRVCDMTAKSFAKKYANIEVRRPSDQILKESAQGFAGAPNGPPRCWILGITNLFIHMPTKSEHRAEKHPPDYFAHGDLDNMTAEDVQGIIDAHDESYLFKRQRSPIVRFRPGGTGDSAWSDVPELAPRAVIIQ